MLSSKPNGVDLVRSQSELILSIGNLGNLIFEEALFEILQKRVGSSRIEVLNQSALVLNLNRKLINSSDWICIPGLLLNNDPRSLGQFNLLISELERTQANLIIFGLGFDLGPADEIGVNLEQAVKRLNNLKDSKLVFFGLRGEISKNYFERILGHEFGVLSGCPSLHVSQPNWSSIRTNIARVKESKGIVFHGDFSQLVLFRFRFLNRNKYTFVQQDSILDNKAKLKSSYKTRQIIDKLLNIEEIFFLDRDSWVEYLRRQAQEGAISVGFRVHGSYASLISSLPNLGIGAGQRFSEMLDILHLPRVDNIQCQDQILDTIKNWDIDQTMQTYQVLHKNFNFLLSNILEQ